MRHQRTTTISIRNPVVRNGTTTNSSAVVCLRRPLSPSSAILLIRRDRLSTGRQGMIDAVPMPKTMISAGPPQTTSQGMRQLLSSSSSSPTFIALATRDMRLRGPRNVLVLDPKSGVSRCSSAKGSAGNPEYQVVWPGLEKSVNGGCSAATMVLTRWLQNSYISCYKTLEGEHET